VSDLESVCQHLSEECYYYDSGMLVIVVIVLVYSSSVLGPRH
jgi:hypothetical protein